MSESFALLESQNAIFMQWKMNPHSLQYNLPFVYTIPDRISSERLEGALKKMTEIHPQLRTCYETDEDGSIRQRVLPEGRPIDQIRTTEANLDDQLQNLIKPFDLLAEIPFRFAIISTEDHRYFFHDIHHVSFDGMSYAAFMNDLNLILNDQSPVGEKVPLEVYVEQEQDLRKKNLESDFSFYDRVLAGRPSSDLPTKPSRTPQGAQQIVQMWENKKIDDFSHAHSISANVLFTSSLALVLSSFSRENCASLYMISHGRPDRDSFGTLGSFSRALPLSIIPGSNDTVLEFLEKNRDLIRETLRHQAPALNELLRRYDLTPAIFFVFQKGADDQYSGSLISRRLPVNESVMPIGLEVFIRKNEYEIRALFDEGIYERKTIEALIGCWRNVLDQIMDHSDKLCREIEMVGSEEKSLLLKMGDGGTLDYDTSKTIIDHFRRQAADHPEQIAVVFQDKKLTYGELDRLTDRLAAYLVTKGAGPDKKIGVMIDRSELLSIYPLSILKAGAAFVPLDFHFPEDRLSYMIENTNMEIILTDQNLVRKSVPNFDGLVFDSTQLADLPDPETITSGPKPEDAFVVIYTSGTTGRPKGCVIEHRNILNLCQWCMEYNSMDSTYRAAAYSNFGFDAHLLDFYPTYFCGSSIYIIPSDMRLNLPELARYVIENKISHVFMTTRLGQQLAETWPNAFSKFMVIGGEALTSAKLPDFSLYNGYGPTECTVMSTIYPIRFDEDLPPIGKALANYSVYVLDSSQRLVPHGIPGELCIGGRGVAREYLNLPDLTAQRFLPNPFGPDRIYRSGDMVRWNENGDIEYLGRMDNQIKLRGFRIELDEIEFALNSYEPITSAVALVREVGGNQAICAWFTASVPVDLDDLRRFLATKLTEFMVPSFFVQLERFSYNANGKIDRKNLPDIVLEENDVQEEGKSRTFNRLETELVGIVEKIIGGSQFGLETNLVRLGLTSLTAIKLAVQIEKKFHIALDVISLMKSCSILDLENLILEKWLEQSPGNDTDPDQMSAGCDQPDPFGKARDSDTIGIEETSPLTPPQLGVYYDCMKDPDSTVYNIPMCWEFPADFDADRLTIAMKKVLVNHPVFFSHFEHRDEEIVQVFSRNADPEVECLSMDSEDLKRFCDEYSKPFDLAGTVLYRTAIIKTQDKVVLLFDVHHLIADGFSCSLILQELSEVWDGKEVARECVTYAEYALKELSGTAGPERKAADSFFETMLSSLESVCEIVPDFNADPQTGSLAEESVVVDSNAVESFCRIHGVTAASLFLAGTCLTLSRFTDSRTVPLSMISSGRSDLSLQNTVGMFVRTLPFSTVIDPKLASLKFVQNVTDLMRETVANEKVSFVEISARYGFHPKIMYACELGVVDDIEIGGTVPQLRPLRLEKPKFPVSVHIEERRGQMIIAVQYNSAMYLPFRMKMLAESLGEAIRIFMKSPEKKIGDLSLISPEQEKLLKNYRCRAEAPIEEPLLHRLFEKQVDETPDKTALIANGEKWTFAELDAEANRIAHSLLARGIRKGDRIIHLLPRSGFVLMATFGILKAGAAFIPCDPDYPQERVEQIIEDSGSKFVITDSAFVDRYGEKAINIETLLKKGDSSRPVVDIDPHDPAYLIYTSGSTGKPKGVILEHRGISNYVTPDPANPHVHAVKQEAHALLSVTTVSFDMSLKEIMVALCNGVTLVLADSDQTRHPGKLADLFESTGADAFNATPSRMKQYLGFPAFRKAIAQCRVIMAGGESFPKTLLDELHQVTKGRIFNTYGPTEITVSSNCKELTHENGTPVIGGPLLNDREYIVDSDRNELPPGARGELLIGGPGVARGYVHLPDKTAESFIDFKGIRVYRSGDRAEWLQNGDVAVHGRIDHQLKMRGLRIESSEVENAVSSFPGIRQSAVDVRTIDGDEYLCCWFVAEKQIDPEMLKIELKKRLPVYMVPAALMQIESIPINMNGKIDFKALPEPSFVSFSEYVAPRGETEQLLCDIFAKVLKRPQIGALDNFFDLGGTSLSVTQIIVETEKNALDITYKDVFAHPTPRALTRLLEQIVPKSKIGSDQDRSEKPALVHQGDLPVDHYDYSRINEILRENSIESFRQGKLQKIGNILITGATGYLGVHFLASYLDQEEGIAYCLVRHKNEKSIEQRLKTILFYYFGDKYENEIGRRIVVIAGDITDPDSFKQLEAVDLDCAINCAANVKHFSAHSDIDDTNRGGVQNLIRFCKLKKVRLIQISTTSVAGCHEPDQTLDTEYLTEQHLFFGQDIGNQYVNSKFLAERAVLEAVSEGLSAKIMRVGNLSARTRDGEFQANFGSNNYVGRLRALFCIGKAPYSIAGQTAEFAPVDSSADAILHLMKTPEKCRIFHIYNPHSVLFGDIITAMKECGLNIDFAEEEIYREAFEKAAANPDYVKYLSSLFAYRASSSQPMVLVPKSNNYTLQILFRLGWQWPVISGSYLVKFIDMLLSLGFFN